MSSSKNSQALKQIDLNKKKFTANGVEYFIESALSFERFYGIKNFNLKLVMKQDFMVYSKD